MPDDLGTVFISYTHDSAYHAQAVLGLSNMLRSEGVDCVIRRGIKVQAFNQRTVAGILDMFRMIGGIETF